MANSLPKKSAEDTVCETYEVLKKLNPSPQEIQAYADLLEKEGRDYSVVTYSKSGGGGGSMPFIDLHDTWRHKRGGRYHIDVGYVDEEFVDERDVPDTTHLMLDKDYAFEFITFVKQLRAGQRTNEGPHEKKP